MDDVYSDLEKVNNAVLQAGGGSGDKRRRNEAIRVGMENPGLYGSLFNTTTDVGNTTGTQPLTTQTYSTSGYQPLWTAPKEWSSSSNEIYQDSAYQKQHQMDSLFNRPGYDKTSPDNKPMSYDEINKLSQQYYYSGFQPGKEVEGWKYTAVHPTPQPTGALASLRNQSNVIDQDGNIVDNSSKQASKDAITNKNGFEGDMWGRISPTDGKTEQYILYNPLTGYNEKQITDYGDEGLGPSIAPILGILASMAMPSLMGLFTAPAAGATGAGVAGSIGSAASGGMEALGALGGGLSAPAVGGIGGVGLTAGAGLAGAMGGINGATALGSLGGLFGQGGILGTGLDTGSSFANGLVENFGKNMVTSSISNGGDFDKAFKSSGINTAIGGAFGMAQPIMNGLLGNDAANIISGMGAPAVQTALQGGSMDKILSNALFGGANAGLKSFLNSNDLTGMSKVGNKNLVDTGTSLAKMFMNKRK